MGDQASAELAQPLAFARPGRWQYEQLAAARLRRALAANVRAS